jgi:microsomal dipeptidase-like Zn-dependent dipeptidase
MVALAVNNRTLAEATAGTCDYPTDDKSSTDLQLAEINGFVRRHPDFMEIAFTPADLARIVRGNKLAIVLGVEVDNIGNLQKKPPHSGTPPEIPTNDAISAEIDRLYSEGVRYIFPIHVIDNAFGGTAAYVDLSNYSNFFERGQFFELTCAEPPSIPSEQFQP